MFAASCSYEGCTYQSKGRDKQAAQNNLSSHISNYHRVKASIRYDGNLVFMYRDPATGKIKCQCGRFSTKNIADLRAHAAKEHPRPQARNAGAHESSSGSVRHGDIGARAIASISAGASGSTPRTMSVDSIMSPGPSPPRKALSFPRPPQMPKPSAANSSKVATDVPSARKHLVKRSSTTQAVVTPRLMKGLPGRVNAAVLSSTTTRKQAIPHTSASGTKAPKPPRIPSPTPSFDDPSDGGLDSNIAVDTSEHYRSASGKTLSKLSSFVPPPHPALSSSEKRASDALTQVSKFKVVEKPSPVETASASRRTAQSFGPSKTKYDASSFAWALPSTSTFSSGLRTIKYYPPPSLKSNDATGPGPSSSGIAKAPTHSVGIGLSASPPTAPQPRFPTSTGATLREGDQMGSSITTTCTYCHKPFVHGPSERVYKMCAPCRERSRGYSKRRREKMEQRSEVPLHAQSSSDENGLARSAKATVSVLGKRNAEAVDTSAAPGKLMHSWRDVMEYQTADAFYAAVQRKLEEWRDNEGDVDCLDMQFGFATVRCPTTTLKYTLDKAEEKLKGIGLPSTGGGAVRAGEKIRRSTRRCKCNGKPKIKLSVNDSLRGKCGGTIELTVELDEEYAGHLGIVGENVILKVVHR